MSNICMLKRVILQCAIRHKPRKKMGGGACSVSVRVDATRKLVVE